MKKKILVLMLASMLAASCVACGSKSSDKKDELSSAATEMFSETETETEQIEEQDITADALTPLADAGVITGVKDITVAEGTDVNLNDLVYADKSIVKSVDIDDSAVDYSKAGTYEVIYTITFEGDKLRDYVKDNNLNVNFDTDGDTIVVKTTVTVTVATKEDADKAIANGATDVVTPETEKSVAESNKAKANDNAVASKPAEKPAGNTGNSNAGKNNSGNNGNHNGNSNGNNGNHNGNNGGNNGNHNGSTEEPHEHKWKTNYKTVTHDAEYKDEPVYEDQPVYKDEPVYEDRPVYKWVGYYECRICGFQSEDIGTMMDHCMDVCDSTYTAKKKQVQTGTERVQTGTQRVQVGTNRVQTGTNHVKVKNAWTEQVPDGEICTDCGATKGNTK